VVTIRNIVRHIPAGKITVIFPRQDFLTSRRTARRKFKRRSSESTGNLYCNLLQQKLPWEAVAMAESTVKKKKSKVVEKEDGKKSSRSKDIDGLTSKRSSSPKKERKVGQKKENSDPSAKIRLSVGSADFEAGVIFNRWTYGIYLFWFVTSKSCSIIIFGFPSFIFRYDKAQKGVITAEEFRQIWREGKLPLSQLQSREKFGVNDDSEASQVSFKVDSSADARVGKKDFENLLREHPELLKLNSDGLSSSVSVQANEEFLLPTEVITGRLLTHYDETAGVALPHSAMEQHKRLGNTVLPLLESYRSRYDRLRSLLTGKLFPRRENLLQLRRQLQNCSAEVEAARKGIERETLSDAEQIVERLRSVEAMRQSSIKHQVGAIICTVCAATVLIDI
jgi:hypothetical protein